MRLSHKRNIQLKLKKTFAETKASANKAIKETKVAAGKIKKEAEKAADDVKVKADEVRVEADKVVTKTKTMAAKVEKVANAAYEAAVEASKDVKLTPKQQQVLDIVAANSDGISPKNIGLEAGQEDAKAASWATGGLKKLLEENLVVKEQIAGNKVLYKIA